MELILIFLIIIIALDFAALRWGYDSRDNIDSPEWKRRTFFLKHHV